MASFAAGTGMLSIGGGIAAAAGAMATLGTTTFASMEQSAISFEVFLGSAEEAKAMMASLSSFAAKTPFELPGITKSAVHLAGMAKMGRGEIMPMLNSLGNLASSVNVPLEELAEVVARNHAAGRYMTKDIREITGRGIDVVTPLLEITGAKDSADFFDNFVEKGKVTAVQVEEALLKMGGTGKLGTMMERQSKTLAGRWSTLKDNFTMGLADVMGSLLEGMGAASEGGLLDSAAQFFGNLATNMQPIVAWLRDTGGPAIREAISSMGIVLQNTWAFMSPIVSSLWGAIVAMASTIGTALANMFGDGTSWWKPLVTFANFLREGLTAAFMATEFAFNNFGLIWQQGMVNIQLSWERFKGGFLHLFTGVIPSVLSWFGRNWKEIFLDVFNYTTTVFLNLVKNIGRIIANLPGLIKGDVSFSDLWTPLATSFETKLKELPKIPQREMSGTEKALNEQLKHVTKALDNNWDKFVAEKQSKLFGEGKATTPGKSIIPPPPPKAPVAPKAKELETPKLASAVEVGSKEASEAVNAWASMIEVEDANRQAVEELRTLNEQVKIVSDHMAVMLGLAKPQLVGIF